MSRNRLRNVTIPGAGPRFQMPYTPGAPRVDARAPQAQPNDLSLSPAHNWDGFDAAFHPAPRVGYNPAANTPARPVADGSAPARPASGASPTLPAPANRPTSPSTLRAAPANIQGGVVQGLLDRAAGVQTRPPANAGAVARATGQQQQTPYGTVGAAPLPDRTASPGTPIMENGKQIGIAGNPQQGPPGPSLADLRASTLAKYPNIAIAGTPENTAFVNHAKSLNPATGQPFGEAAAHANADHLMQPIVQQGPPTPTPSDEAAMQTAQSKLQPGLEPGAPKPGKAIAQAAQRETALQQDADSQKPGLLGQIVDHPGAAAASALSILQNPGLATAGLLGRVAGRGADNASALANDTGPAVRSLVHLPPRPGPPDFPPAGQPGGRIGGTGGVTAPLPAPRPGYVPGNTATGETSGSRPSGAPDAPNAPSASPASATATPDVTQPLPLFRDNVSAAITHGPAFVPTAQTNPPRPEEEKPVPNLASGGWLPYDPLAGSNPPVADANAGWTSGAPMAGGLNPQLPVSQGISNGIGQAEDAVRNYAKGYVPGGMKPAMQRERRAISKGVGGAPRSARPVPVQLPGKGPAVINSSERVVPTPKGPAVLNRRQQRQRYVPGAN